MIVEAAISLNSAIGELDGIISEMKDGEWRQDLVNSLATGIGEIYAGMIAPVTKIYRDLDPYNDVDS